MNYYIKPREWESIFRILQRRRDINKVSESKLRIYIEGIYYIMRIGCQWRMFPSLYGKWRSIHKRFKEWSDKGVWSYLFEEVKDKPDMENVMIDTTIVRAHACSSGYKKDGQEGESLGRSKGGFSTKIHTLVDGLGNPLKFILTVGQRDDIIKLKQKNYCTMVIADKGYDSDILVEFIKAQSSIATIPPRKNLKIQREYDKHIYIYKGIL